MNKRPINLVPAIKALEEQIKEIRSEYLETVRPYEDSLRELRKLNTACERCNGTGKLLRHRSCAEDDRPDPNDPADYVKCMRCGGTGIGLAVETEEGDDAEETETVRGTCSNCKYHWSTVYADITGTGSYTKYYCFGEKDAPEVSPGHSCESWKLEGNL